jgi:anaerobic selenocysteine-containing dehydrogenase
MKTGIRWTRTHCARMDHGGCAILVGTENNRIVKIKGDGNGFLNKGYVCPKGLASSERLAHPNRLKHPLKRKGKRGGGEWEKISWEEAIRIISRHFLKIKEQYGARGVAFCQGMPKGMEHFVLIRLANLFGSPNVVAVQDVCHAPREVTGMHTCGFYSVTDFHHRSKTVLVWGSNATHTNEEGEICSLLLEQLKQGTRLIVIDPRRTDLAGKAALWLQPRPATDHFLALAFLNVIIEENLFDRPFVETWTHGFEDLAGHVKAYAPEKVSDFTWVDPDLIRKAARFYAESGPAAIHWGNALEQNSHTFDALRAITCIMALCGNLDIPGGNIQANEPKILPLGKYVRADLLPNKWKEMIHAARGTIPRLMTVPPAFFRKAVLEEDPYPVKGAYVQCANPVMAYADSHQTVEALSRLDFLAVSDLFMTPTATLADIVLPAATHFEFDDIGHYGLGHGYILARPKVVDPPVDCRPDIQILNDLGLAMTSKEHWFDDYHALVEMLLKPSGLTFKAFTEQGYLKGKDRFKKYEVKGFKTPSKKVELCLSTAEKFKLHALPEALDLPEDDPDYPLVLTSSKDQFYLHSAYRWVKKLREKSPEPMVEIHPETAAALGIQEGDAVRIETRAGQIRQRARLTPHIHPRVVSAAYGWWFPEEDIVENENWTRANFNILTTTDGLGREFGTPNLKGLSCRISPAPI